MENSNFSNNETPISRRAHVLSILREEPISCTEIAKIIGCSHTSISYHLSKLEKDHLIIRNKDGSFDLHPFLAEHDNYEFLVSSYAFLVFRNKETFKNYCKEHFEDKDEHIHDLMTALIEIALYDFRQVKI